MKDPIERQDAIDALKKISFSHWFECGEYFSEDTREIKIISSSKALEAIEALPSAEPAPQWIPCSEPPKESGTYIVTAYDGTDKRVTFVKYQKTLKRWDLTGARSYWHILAYKPLPEPWRGEEHEQT